VPITVDAKDTNEDVPDTTPLKKPRRWKIVDESSLVFPCPLCDFAYDKERKLWIHMKKWHLGSSTVCEHCGETMGEVWRLFKHQQEVHAIWGPSVRLPCPSCDMTFKTELTLRRHVQSKHGSTTAIREHSGESSNERRQEEVHTIREPTTIPESVSADGCDAFVADTEANVSDRAAGIPQKMIVKEKPAKVRKKIVKDKPAKVPKKIVNDKVVEVPGKTVKDNAAQVPEDIVEHETAEASNEDVDDVMAEHVGEPPVKKRVPCRICDATFRFKRGLRAHLKSKHEARDENLRFPCPSCDTTYKFAANLREHVKSSHAITTTICEHCGKSFDDGWQLYLHQRKVCKDNG
jgi:uncharacterized C2H2 Zn-finger protein